MRLTVVFAVVMAVVLAATGLTVHAFFRRDLDNGINRSLRARSGEVAGLMRAANGAVDPSLGRVNTGPDDFAEVLTTGGRLLAATPQVRGRVLLGGAALRRAARGTVVVEHPQIPGGPDGRLRLRAVSADARGGRVIVVVGSALGERDDSLRTLAALLGAGGAFALILASLAGYGVATAALRPVEAMRSRAAAISPAESGRRLPVPGSGDEIARLGETLNAMLDRLESAFAREREFAADASHELRTPLGILKAELELALRRGRSPEELRAALESAAEETDRLIRLAEDLLVLARLDQGRLQLRLGEVDARALLERVAGRFATRAGAAGRSIEVQDDGELQLQGDGARLEQAVDTIVDNALRHGAGDVRLSAVARERFVELHVVDGGAGFPDDFLADAFERFARADGARSRGGTGLGLAIVQAIAASHGGNARAANLNGGGADVWLELPGVSVG